MKKNAFTLIELLGVIILIGLLAVLIIPKVNKTIKDARTNTNEVSANALSRTATNYYLEQKTQTRNFQNCAYDFTNNINTCTGLEFTGQKPESGKLSIKKNGDVALAVQFEKKCYIKGYNKDKVEIIDYNESTCGENADVFINYEMPELAASGDGLYESLGEPGRYVYKGTNPNNYINLKENGTEITYRIVSYESDGTIKVVRAERINTSGNEWDESTARQNVSNTYCNTENGCNVWGNQGNIYYNNQTLSTLNQDFYFYYYEDNGTTNLSIKPNSNFGTVTANSSLNAYLNNTWINILDFKDKIENHSFDTGGLYYINSYSGGDKGLVKEKEEEKIYKWNGKIGLLSITEFAESSSDQNCISVYSNYYHALNSGGNLVRDNLPSEGWPCKNSNFNYKNYNQWSLSAVSNNRYDVWILDGTGGYFYIRSANNSTIAVRPAFYLKSSVKLSGTGESSDPYRIINM